MPQYAYIVQTDAGVLQRGQIHGFAPAEVRERLASGGRRLVSIHQLGGDESSGSCRSVVQRQRSWRWIRSADLELTLQQLAVMLESGLELTESLRELSLHSPRRSQRALCDQLAVAVEQGQSFAQALTQSQAFPAVVAQLARVGEETGELAVTLTRAAQFVQTRRQTRGNLLSALAYPLIVAAAALTVAVYLVGWAIPKLADFLHALGRKLPSMTQSLLDLSTQVQMYGLRVSVLIFVAGIGVAMLYAWQPGRLRIDQALLRVPMLGTLMRMAETTQLASALSLMLRSGVFLPEALATAAALHRNRFLAAQVLRSRQRLSHGRDLATAFDDAGFSPMLGSMVAVGQRTGDLPQALEHVATFYSGQVEKSLQRFGRLIEPTIIAVVGCIVGYVYIAFFMALMSAGGNFK